MTNDTVPQWAQDYLEAWMERFFLHGWAVTFQLARVVDDNPDCLGLCERNSNYNQVTITLRDDVEDTPKWRKVIVHELLHIVMARVDAFVQDAILPGMYETSKDIAQRGYTQHVESFIQFLTDSFYWMDNPEGKQD